LAAVLSNRGGYYQPFAYVSEARRLGLAVLPPCVNRSDVAYRGRERELRVGLLEVGGLSDEGARRVVAEREANGLYRDLASFRQRTRLRPEDLRLLARTGALDALSVPSSRSSIIMQVDVLNSYNQGRKRSQQLFEDQAPMAGFPVPPLKPGRLRRLEWETLGFPVTFHPLDPWREHILGLSRRGPPLVAGRDLGQHVGRRVRTVGWWITGKVVESMRKEPMEFVSFEDTTASYETVLFPDVYQQVRRQLSPLRPYLLQGKVEAEFGVATLTVERVAFLDDFAG
jgi:error-prone DNA polymerase